VIAVMASAIRMVWFTPKHHLRNGERNLHFPEELLLVEPAAMAASVMFTGMRVMPRWVKRMMAPWHSHDGDQGSKVANPNSMMTGS
jgi:hypothetical protein